MMMDIFSSFDPHTNSLNKISLLIMVMITLSIIMASLSTPLTLNKFFSSTSLEVMKTQASRTNSMFMSPASLIFTSTFVMIILFNLLGMVPYFFSYTSHLFFTFSLGVPMWLLLIMSGMINKPMNFMAHFLPSGAPLLLAPFLVIIELVSTLVRPVTLSFRLAANMSAGHIVIALISTYLEPMIFNPMTFSFPLLFSIQAFYFMFETAICLIQAYIFCLLLTLYSDDHPMWNG